MSEDDRGRPPGGPQSVAGRLRRAIVTHTGARRAGKRAAAALGTRAIPPGAQLEGIRLTRAARRLRATSDVFDYPDPPDPYALRELDPASLERFSARVHPAWWGRRRAFGAVEGGDWDRRPYSEAPRHPAYPTRGERGLLYADSLSETPLCVAISQRVREGVDWEETAFVARVEERIASGEAIWQDCRTVADVRRRCRELDAIARSIRAEGYKTQRELLAEGAVVRMGVLHALGNEIVVDVARDGEPLLVSGKHRLSIARALGLEAVPVAVRVRHEGWMAP